MLGVELTNYVRYGVSQRSRSSGLSNRAVSLIDSCADYVPITA